jgi:hypothetical protein
MPPAQSSSTWCGGPAKVVQRIRQLAKKTAPRKTSTDLNHVVQDVVLLLRAEFRRTT